MRKYLLRHVHAHPMLKNKAVWVLILVAVIVGAFVTQSTWLTPQFKADTQALITPRIAQAATWQGNQYGLPNFGGYTMPTNCYSYQDYSRNYQSLPDCHVSNVVAEFSVHTQGLANGLTAYATASSNSGYVYSGCCGADQTTGSAVSVPYGTTLSLEWSCMTNQNITYSYCTFMDPYNNCYDTAESTWTDSFFSSSNYGPLVSSQTVTATANTSYSLTCSGNAGSHTLTIPVKISTPACTNGQGFAGSCTSCNSGYVLQGTVPSNSCTTACSNGSGAAGKCTACNSGYVLQGTSPSNSCAVQCPHGTGAAGSCTACTSPYVLQGGTCLLPSGAIPGALKAAANRIQKNAATTLSWSTTGMTSCTVKNDAGATLSTQTSSASTPTGALTHPSIFTLSCTDGIKTYTSTATVGLVPSVIEI